jgi:outer membrane protein
MKRSLPLLFIGLSLIVFSMLPADSVVAAGGSSAGRVGFVDLQRTLLETSVGKKAKKSFEATKAKKQADLDKQQKDFQKAAAELDRQRMMLKPDVLEKKTRALEQQYVAVQQTYAKLERELAEAQGKLIKNILEKAAPVIKSIATKGGYSLVLDRSAVLWADDSVDLTDELNKQIK